MNEADQALDVEAPSARRAHLARGTLRGLVVAGVAAVVLGLVLQVVQQAHQLMHDVTAMPRADVYGPLWARAAGVLLSGCGALATVLMAAALWSRAREAEVALGERRAEIARLEIERQLQVLAHDANDIILVLDATGRVTDANARATSAYQLERAALLGRDITALVDAGAFVAIEERLRTVAAGGKADFESRHLRQLSREPFPVDVRLRRLGVHEGRRYLCVIRDLTERKRGEEAIAASEAKFRAAFREAPVGTALIARDGAFVESNAALERMLGYGAEALRGLRYQDLLHEEDRAESLAAFERLMSGVANRKDTQRRYVRADGSILHARYSTSLVHGPDGGVKYCLAVIEDVTAEVKAVDALRESEERLRLALDATDDAVWDWDVEHDRLHLSPRYLPMLGLDPADVKTMGDALALFHPDERGRVETLIRSAMEGTIPAFEAEHRVRTSMGAWKWILTRGKVVARDPAGRPLRAVGAQCDVDERRMLRATVRQSELLAAVGTVTAGVAHEINSPLAYVSANLRFALDVLRGGLAAGKVTGPELPAGAAVDATVLREAADALQDAITGAERIRVIVRDLRMLSRTDEAGAPIDARRALESALRLARPDIEARAHLTQDLAPVPLVLANEARLGQVFLNLLVNAVQAMADTPRDRNVLRATARADSGHVVVEVADTGCGIAPEVLPRIFDPFFTTKPPGEGTGLGLSICHELVSGFGGRIEVQSEVGRGTVFRVMLPALPAPA
jgi:PAS domain S-box-containing protein